eukprot:jgi/Ulvmu1/8618/UM046_0018.1
MHASSRTAHLVWNCINAMPAQWPRNGAVCSLLISEWCMTVAPTATGVFHKPGAPRHRSPQVSEILSCPSCGLEQPHRLARDDMLNTPLQILPGHLMAVVQLWPTLRTAHNCTTFKHIAEATVSPRVWWSRLADSDDP